MFSSTAYVIRPATEQDDFAIRALAALSHRPPVAPVALVGELRGVPAAALSLADGRVVSDPGVSDDRLLAHMRQRAAAFAAHARQPSLRERIREGLRPRSAPAFA